MDKIGVFCSAAADLPASYTQAAKDLGTWIGQNHKTLVYGGTWKGLMVVIGMACKEAGGQPYGIYPHYMEGKGFIETELDVCFPTAGLADRKDLLILNSDVLVALPGGIGTLDEALTTMGMAAAGEMDKQIIFLNVDGFWQPVIDFMEQLHRMGMLRHEPGHYFQVAGSVEELIKMITD